MALPFQFSAKVLGAAALVSILGLGAPTSAYALTEQEAQDIAVETYVYVYPLVLMDITRKQLTNAECESAWNKAPSFGVIGIQSGPRG